MQNSLTHIPVTHDIITGYLDLEAAQTIHLVSKIKKILIMF